MMRPDLVEVDAVQQSNVWRLFRQHPTVGTCIQAMRNAIFGGGINVEPGLINSGGKSKGSRGHPAIDERRIQLMADRALEWLVCIGVIPVTYEMQSKEQGGGLLPVVPIPEALKLYVRVTPSGALEYEARFQRSISVLSGLGGSAATSSDAPKVLVWSQGEYTPTSTGRLVTPITHLEQSERFVNFLKRKVMIAEEIRCNPYVASQTRAKVNNDQDLVTFNVPDEVAERAEVARLRTLEGVQHQQRLMHEDHWADGGVPLNSAGEETLHEESRPREYFVSAEREVARNLPPSSAVSELLHHVRLAEEKIYQIFGIPTGMFSQQGSQFATNYMQEYALNNNMRRIKIQLERFLNDTVTLCVELSSESVLEADRPDAKRTKQNRREGDNGGGGIGNSTAPNVDGKQMVRGVAERPQRTLLSDTVEEAKARDTVADYGSDEERPLTEANVDDTHTFKRIDTNQTAAGGTSPVVIPGAPCIRFAEMTMLYDRGVITAEESCNLMRGMIGFSKLTKAGAEASYAEAANRAISYAQEGVKKIEDGTGTLQTKPSN